MSNEASGGEMKLSSPFFKKLDNYWYHYKWHTIGALILALAIIICSFQMCSKEKYDFEVVYAGPVSFINKKQDVLDIMSSLESVVGDRNGDGEAHVNFYSYWVDDNIKDTEGVTTGDLSLMQNTSNTNKNAYYDEIKAGNITVFLVTPTLFSEVDKQDGFVSITEIAPEFADIKEDICIRDEVGRLNTRGVLLSKTALGQMPGLRNLPADTILCIRKPAALKSFFVSKKRAEAIYAQNTECFKSLLLAELNDD